eukprot:1374412-Amorphochlora_amoeboformis.AAC.1
MALLVLFNVGCLALIPKGMIFDHIGDLDRNVGHLAALWSLAVNLGARREPLGWRFRATL